MKIETESYGTCSWCKVTGVHPTLVTWRWERRINGVTQEREPAVCGACWIDNEPHRTSGVPVRTAAREWTSIERKFAPVEITFGTVSTI